MATNTTHYNLVKPAYTEPADIGVINGDMDLIDSALHDHDIALEEVESSIAIVATGNTHAAISSGQYVYVKEHTALADGLYTASTNIDANATLSSSNLTAVSGGGMNALKASVNTLNNNLITNETAASSAYRNVWFSDNTNDLKRVHNADFQYNPGTNDLKVGTINGKTVKQIYTKDYNIATEAWSAGTPGTRATQTIIDITDDKSSYGIPIAVSIVYVGDSSVANYQAFLHDNRNLLYVNAYRAGTGPVVAQTQACSVRVAFAK